MTTNFCHYKIEPLGKNVMLPVKDSPPAALMKMISHTGTKMGTVFI